MKHVLFYVLPVALFLAFVLALPAPQGMFGSAGLAQVISNESTTCLSACNRNADVAVQACATLGAENLNCNQAAMTSRESCLRGCMTVAPTVTIVPPVPVVAVPTPVLPSTPAAPIPAVTVVSPQTEFVSLPQCEKSCVSLGNTYANTCLAAGRTRTQCQALYDAFALTCKSVACQLKTDVASPLIMGEAMRCVTNCGGVNGVYQYDQCRKEYDASTCSKFLDNTVTNHCLPQTCPAALSLIRNVPSAESFEAILGRAVPQVAEVSVATTPGVSQDGSVSLPTQVAPQNQQGTNGQNPPLTQVPVSPNGDVSGARPQKPSANPVAILTQSTVAPTQITSVLLGRSVFSAIVSFIGDFFGGTSGESTASPSETPAATTDVCLNTPASVKMTTPVHSGSVMGEYYRNNGCPVAVAAANAACYAAAERVVADQVKTKCAQLCKRTGTKLCTPEPVVANVVIKGCDLSATTKVTNIAPGGDGAWAYGDSGGSNGFCFAKSSTKGTGVTADLDCNCGGGE